MMYKNHNLPIDKILCGDNLELIQQLPDCSVQLVITSPPYFQQRDYARSNARLRLNGGGMGNEESIEEYIEILLHLFRECVRVIKDDGSIVFNLGDKYQSGLASRRR